MLKVDEFRANVNILVIHVAATGQVPVCVRHLLSRPNGEKVQTANLIFIYFSKREGGSYWKGALVRRNTVCTI